MNKDLSGEQASFESIKHVDENGNEYWEARELMPFLGYTRWESSEKVINRAEQSAITVSVAVENHFQHLTKKVSVGYGNDRQVADYRLSRYACYLIAQNGDPSKPVIAVAQTYFAVQTHRQEVEDGELKRLGARKKLSETEKRFSTTMHRRNVDGRGIGEIRASGDKRLFGGKTTKEMKELYNVSNKKPLADVLPTISIKAKDLAAEMTTVNTEEKDLRGKTPIKQEHLANNDEVRGALTKRGIKPENLPPEEDTKKIERRIKADKKKLKRQKQKKRLN